MQIINIVSNQQIINYISRFQDSSYNTYCFKSIQLKKQLFQLFDLRK